MLGEAKPERATTWAFAGRYIYKTTPFGVSEGYKKAARE